MFVSLCMGEMKHSRFFGKMKDILIKDHDDKQLLGEGKVLIRWLATINYLILVYHVYFTVSHCLIS